jgi:hypothetical protein
MVFAQTAARITFPGMAIVTTTSRPKRAPAEEAQADRQPEW